MCVSFHACITNFGREEEFAPENSRLWNCLGSGSKFFQCDRLDMGWTHEIESPSVRQSWFMKKKQSFGGWNFGWPAGTVGILSRKANDILFAGCLPFLVSGKLSWPLRHISVDLSWMFWWVASGQTNGMEFLSIMMRPRYWTHDCLDLVWFDFISCFMFMETMHGRGELQCNNLDFVFWRFYLVLCIHSKYFEGGYHVTRGRRLERPHQVPILLSPFGSWDAGTQPMDMFFWTSFKVYITAFVPET